MKTHNVIVLLIVLPTLLSCSSTKFAISSGEEGLISLSKVTDGDAVCINPFGGDNSKDLFYASQEDKKYYNIYKKDNPFATATTQKTHGKNFNAAPAYCPAIDKLAFKCQSGTLSAPDIFMMSATKGQSLTQITETPNDFENNPDFSKDGKLIVYDKQIYTPVTSKKFLGTSSTVIEKSEIWMKNLETGESMLLANGYQPRFSPDGKHIVYVKYSTNLSCNIWIMDIDGGSQVQITNDERGFAYYPRWSPSGSKIIFQLTKKNKNDADIYIVDIDGNNLQQITANRSYDGQPYWTTDGYIYFTSDRGSTQKDYQIWRFKLDDF